MSSWRIPTGSSISLQSRRNHGAVASERLAQRRPVTPSTAHLQRQVGAALSAHRQVGFLQVEFALEPAARLVSETSLAQKLVQELALGRDQLQPQVHLLLGGFGVVSSRKLPQPSVLALSQLTNGVLRKIALGGEFLQALPCPFERVLARHMLGVRLPRALLDAAVRQPERAHHRREQQAEPDQAHGDDAERDE